MTIAMSTESSNLVSSIDNSSSGELELSFESSLDLVSSASSGEPELSFESSSLGSGDESGPEGIHPFLYEPIASDSEDEGSDSSVDDSPRLLNLNW